jgi:hypothetical protein
VFSVSMLTWFFSWLIDNKWGRVCQKIN